MFGVGRMRVCWHKCFANLCLHVFLYIEHAARERLLCGTPFSAMLTDPRLQTGQMHPIPSSHLPVTAFALPF